MNIETLCLGEYQTNAYILSLESGECVVIDPADNGEMIARCIVDKGLFPVAILLTHGHYDHISEYPGSRKNGPIYQYTVTQMTAPRKKSSMTWVSSTLP